MMDNFAVTFPDNEEIPLTLIMRVPLSGVYVILNRVATKSESSIHGFKEVDWMMRSAATCWELNIVAANRNGIKRRKKYVVDSE